MPRVFQLASVGLAVALRRTRNRDQPFRFNLHLKTEADQWQFHRELIPIEYSYSTDGPGRFGGSPQSKELAKQFPAQPVFSTSAKGFIPSPLDSKTLMITLGSARKALQAR